MFGEPEQQSELLSNGFRSVACSSEAGNAGQQDAPNHHLEVLTSLVFEQRGLDIRSRTSDKQWESRAEVFIPTKECIVHLRSPTCVTPQVRFERRRVRKVTLKRADRDRTAFSPFLILNEPGAWYAVTSLRLRIRTGCAIPVAAGKLEWNVCMCAARRRRPAPNCTACGPCVRLHPSHDQIGEALHLKRFELRGQPDLRPRRRSR